MLTATDAGRRTSGIKDSPRPPLAQSWSTAGGRAAGSGLSHHQRGQAQRGRGRGNSLLESRAPGSCQHPGQRLAWAAGRGGGWRGTVPGQWWHLSAQALPRRLQGHALLTRSPTASSGQEGPDPSGKVFAGCRGNPGARGKPGQVGVRIRSRENTGELSLELPGQRLGWPGRDQSRDQAGVPGALGAGAGLARGQTGSTVLPDSTARFTHSRGRQGLWEASSELSADKTLGLLSGGRTGLSQEMLRGRWGQRPGQSPAGEPRGQGRSAGPEGGGG